MGQWALPICTHPGWLRPPGEPRLSLPCQVEVAVPELDKAPPLKVLDVLLGRLERKAKLVSNVTFGLYSTCSIVVDEPRERRH